MLLTTRSWEPPAFDAAVSEALLRGAARHGPFLRLFVPGRAVVFGRQDRARPGFEDAIVAAVEAGYAPVMRLAGGRAAVFHEGTIALALSVPEADPRETITDRYRFVSEAVAGALRSLGADARVGEVPGEYCPGAYSVNIAGRLKVAGIGQRLIAGAAHVGGVIVVTGDDTVNDVLDPVYRALGYEWDPGSTGALDRSIDASLDEVIDTVAQALGGDRLERGDPPPSLVRAASEHVAGLDLAIA